MSYKILNQENRIHYSLNENQDLCDKDEAEGNDWQGEGWYRVLPPAGTRLSTEGGYSKLCLRYNGHSGVLNDHSKHPEAPGVTSNGTVCFREPYKSCQSWSSGSAVDIQIKNCGAYYLYYLKPAPKCPYRYCTE